MTYMPDYFNILIEVITGWLEASAVPLLSVTGTVVAILSTTSIPS